jgi:hypothetical protein
VWTGYIASNKGGLVTLTASKECGLVTETANGVDWLHRQLGRKRGLVT